MSNKEREIKEKEEIMEYTKEYCIEMHRKMWNRIYEKTKEEIETMSDDERRHFLKNLTIKFLHQKEQAVIAEFNENGILKVALRKMCDEYNNSFACMYAFTKEDVVSEDNQWADGVYCKSCPLKWNAEDTGFQCSDAAYGKLENPKFTSIEELLETIKSVAEIPRS